MMLNKLTFHHRTNPWELSSSYIKSINYSRICNYKMLMNCQHDYLTPHLKMVRIALLSLSLLLLLPDTICQEVSGQLLSLIRPESANRWRGGFNTNQIVLNSPEVPFQKNPYWIFSFDLLQLLSTQILIVVVFNLFLENIKIVLKNDRERHEGIHAWLYHLEEGVCYKGWFSAYL